MSILPLDSIWVGCCKGGGSSLVTLVTLRVFQFLEPRIKTRTTWGELEWTHRKLQMFLVFLTSISTGSLDFTRLSESLPCTVVQD